MGPCGSTLPRPSVNFTQRTDHGGFGIRFFFKYVVRGRLAVKDTCLFCKGPGFISPYLHGDPQPSVTPVPVEPVPSKDIGYIHYTYIHEGKTFTHMK